MFEILPNPSLETLLLIGRAVMLIGAFGVFALAFIRWRRADAQSHVELREHLDSTLAEVRSLHETVAAMRARLDTLSERAEVDSHRAPAGVASHRGYDMAARLARNGASSADLVANCGITRHEAELLLRVHNAKTGVRPGAEASAQTRHPSQHFSSGATATTQRQPNDFQQALTRSEARLTMNAPAAQPPPAQSNAGASRKRGSLLSVVG